MLLYKAGATILKKLECHEGSVKNLIFASKYKNPKQLYALIFETLKYANVLEEILEETKFLNYVGRVPKEVIKLLVYDFLFGKGIQCSGKFKKLIYSRKSMLQSALARIKIKQKVVKNEELISSQSTVILPKYLRVNTLKIMLVDVLKTLFDDGYTEVTKLPSNLDNKDFIVDTFIPNLLTFHSNTDFHDYSLYMTGQLIFQDLSSCIPAQVLSPPLNSDVIDACAAPGNKTSHLAAIMKNTGKIFAFDIEPKRIKTMKKLLNKAGVSNCDVNLKSFLRVSIKDLKYLHVSHILVDPSCSGSGMVNRMPNATDNAQSNSRNRLEKLAQFQLSVLNHALSFPNVLRVVYSTCSVHDLENENVVKQALHKNHHFSLIKCLPRWKRRGNVTFGLSEGDAEKCVRCDPMHDFTNGFFVALFERNNKSDRNDERTKRIVEREPNIKRKKFKKCK